MLIKNTVKAKVIAPTERKQELLNREYQAFQDALYGEDANLHLATKQQAERFLKED